MAGVLLSHRMTKFSANRSIARTKCHISSLMLGGISPVGAVQADLLEPLTTSDTKLMRAIDGLNSRFGRGTVKVSTGGLRDEWAMKQERKSPNYTTDWDAVPAV